MTPAEIAARRLHSQRLVGPPLPSVVDAVGWLGAVQAQDYAGAAWGLAQRTTGADRAAVDAALADGSVLRTHVLRPTWHLVRPADLRGLLALTAPRVKAALALYDRRLGLDGPTLARGHALVAAALGDGRPRTRPELAAALDAGGVPARGQRLAHLLMHAELDALVVSGPLRGTAFTYALFDARVPPAPPRPRDAVLADLALRYATGHGPATAHDFAWWAGLTVTDARSGLESVRDRLERADADGRTYWFEGSVPAPPLKEPVVHLLPNYDEHVVAYRDHGPSLDPGAPRALDGWGTARTAHLVVRNGLVVGGWRRALERDRVVVRLSLPVTLTPPERAALDRAADAYGRFSAFADVVVDGV